MNLETFFKKFDTFADAPDAVKAMREIVLQLAVRGSLTDQISGESTKTQIQSSESFRTRRGKRGAPDSNDIPFNIPANWGWVAVGDVMEMINGKAFKPEDWSTEGIPIIRIQNLNNEHAPFNHCKFEIDQKLHVNNGEFLISWSGTPGTSFGAFIWNRGFAYLNQHIFRCELVEGVFLKEFLRLAINARLDEMISHAQGAVGLRHITKGKLESIRLPLPPLAEQKRIVAKVEELMALCDRLEAQQQERATRHAALARASLSRFAEAPTPANLKLLFHPSYDIPPAQLRKAILTLAVQGKLVAQDPKDESADDMLNKIEAEKKRLSEKGELKADKKAWDKTSATPPHGVPKSWRWVRLQDIFEISRGGSPRPAGDPRFFGGSIPWITVGEVTKDLGRYLTETSTGLTEEGSVRSRFINPGDLLLTNSGATLGVPKISKIRGCMNDGVAVLRLFHQFDFNEFGYLYLTHQTQAFRNVNQGMGQPNLNTPIIAGWFFPLPPLAEQRRIVAKVDELMALVDALETQLATARERAGKLLEAVVAELSHAAAGVVPEKASPRAATVK
jgi:type I restriction enzyme S subunit